MILGAQLSIKPQNLVSSDFFYQIYQQHLASLLNFSNLLSWILGITTCQYLIYFPLHEIDCLILLLSKFWGAVTSNIWRFPKKNSQSFNSWSWGVNATKYFVFFDLTWNCWAATNIKNLKSSSFNSFLSRLILKYWILAEKRYIDWVLRFIT